MSSNILLIEPDSILGRTYQTVLTKKGRNVRWLRSASAAIASLNHEVPAVVIIELQLPTHNGVEFLYEFRSYQDLVDIPVIVLTSIPPMLKAFSNGLWEHLGVVAYHYKPLTKLTDLNRSVDRILATQ
jgi:DNA-binding NtrC family response regulator